MESNEERQAKTVRDTLLNLPDTELHERRKVRRDYAFYKGKSANLKLAKETKDKALYGQNWETDDNCDYKPTQDIRNKVKPLLKKQARWMFGKEPTLMFKPNDFKDKDKCEELRRFIDDIFEENNFWSNTRKAFLESTIKKRVLLRVEANPNMPLVIKYETIENFYYKEKNGVLLKVIFFEEDELNVYREADSDKIYYLHTYYYKVNESTGERQAWYMKQTYKNTNLQEELTIDQDTGFSTIPCWLIKNGGELNDSFGESDITELEDAQNQYNRRISDFADALRFQLFGAETVIDGNAEDVNNFTIAPNALHAVRTRDELLNSGKQATVQRQEYNIGNSAAMESYLDRAENDMNFALDMPKLSDLNNIPSAKAMIYLYNDLIARCGEKWNDWERPLLELIDFILEVGKVCYPKTFNAEWSSLQYTKILKQNFPLPSDEDDKKTMAISEVKANVRSRKSYIKEFSDEEDSEKAFEEILEEMSQITNAETDQYTKSLDSELNGGGNNGEE
ncbi:phage portal protein [Clostridium beijerinckii]|uniref:phage portal protein n=1 Tax=Clostridium beijerinckii TaxID=1520 RepID=UPI0013612033|nr:phage portal protein [Clostridium beijerinckii]MZK53663.1 phage portal protein [Clostridium beijerinckii]MZK61792.1 phage portal protein [Clostridium beijerinckii]MZK71973.1 phage portal protein [Clostridium beijerinckii]MZK77366.1 phage portal protein [Clostridium beijerinckii]MZK86944.1 phage portal protein [Clostridium beijerinckii]